MRSCQETSGLGGPLLLSGGKLASLVLCRFSGSEVLNHFTFLPPFRILTWLSFVPFPEIMSLCLGRRVRKKQIYIIFSRLESLIFFFTFLCLLLWHFTSACLGDNFKISLHLPWVDTHFESSRLFKAVGIFFPLFICRLHPILSFLSS